MSTNAKRKQKKVWIGDKRVAINYYTEQEFFDKYAALINAPKKEKKLLFSDVAYKWIDNHEDDIEYYTRECYKAPLRDCINWFGRYAITDIHPKDIQARLKEMVDKGYARQTVNLRKVVMTQVFKYAMFNEWVTSNPAIACTITKAHKTKRTPPADDVVPIINNNALNDWFSFFVFLCLATGGRRSEVLALCKSDFDFKNDTITINKSSIFERGTQVFRPYGKSDSADRAVPILAQFKPTMMAYLDKADERLFPYCESVYNRHYRYYRNEHNVTFTMHELRHLFATYLVAAGYPPKETQRIMGHSKFETTMNIYAHAMEHFDASKLNEKFASVINLSSNCHQSHETP